MKVEKENSELIKVGMYYYDFLPKVNDSQLTRFEKYAYKHCISKSSGALEKVVFWVGCEIAARSIGTKKGC
jgi:hypothetical protein